MIYVTSDLHGCPLENLEALLSSAAFCENDFLFVLGDVIDRGEHSAQLLEWLTFQSNVELILGNHEAMMLSCDFLLKEITDESVSAIDSDTLRLFSIWMSNSGDKTVSGLREIKERSPERLDEIYEYLRLAPLYDCVSAGGRDFLLVHSGLGDFEKDKKLSDYSSDELLWNRPKLGDSLFRQRIQR